ncbi:hypothetical protein BDA96_03G253600 [Sorghum bicolor]|uniref:Secreted protein n=2 Tax=Sorghum bicolor TaxID=4558 RepID=A0A921RDX2_SORBI|nr:hypothetical protein BDA96_03G253600 [Sorghum bicolor]OQU87215.1 hypothetical protein SORBI_3003G234101 [Sorghum bicolor]
MDYFSATLWLLLGLVCFGLEPHKMRPILPKPIWPDSKSACQGSSVSTLACTYLYVVVRSRSVHRPRPGSIWHYGPYAGYSSGGGASFSAAAGGAVQAYRHRHRHRHRHNWSSIGSVGHYWRVGAATRIGKTWPRTGVPCKKLTGGHGQRETGEGRMRGNATVMMHRGFRFACRWRQRDDTHGERMDSIDCQPFIIIN